MFLYRIKGCRETTLFFRSLSIELRVYFNMPNHKEHKEISLRQ